MLYKHTTDIYYKLRYDNLDSGIKKKFTLHILTQTKEIICKIPELFLAPISEWQ